MYSVLSFDRTINSVLRQIKAEKMFRVSPNGKLCLSSPGRAWELPWIIIGNPRRKFCYHWNHVYCGMAGIIPRFCRFNCWKVVVKPRTLKETLSLYDTMRVLDLPSKIGADVRTYTFGPWAAFFYGDSLDQAKAYYAIIKPEIPNETPIIVKRGCTEMEGLQPSNTWDDLSEDDKRLEAALDDLFEMEEMPFSQSAWAKNQTMEMWVKQAIMIGDPTAREMAETLSMDSEIWERLVVCPVTYHGEGDE